MPFTVVGVDVVMIVGFPVRNLKFCDCSHAFACDEDEGKGLSSRTLNAKRKTPLEKQTGTRRGERKRRQDKTNGTDTSDVCRIDVVGRSDWIGLLGCRALERGSGAFFETLGE